MHAQAGHAPKSLRFKHCDETHGLQDVKHTLRVTRIQGEKKLVQMKAKKEAGRKEVRNKASAKAW